MTQAGEASALELTLRGIEPLLARPGLTELCINRPGEAWLETSGGWRREPLPVADFDWCRRLARLAANASHQRLDEQMPLLSASLPGGERVQVAIPPATLPGTVSITIRRPPQQVWSLEELASRGVFQGTRVARPAPDALVARLQALLGAGEHVQFMREAVSQRLNILVSGPTGSGKTTCTKALVREIPGHERLVTIEDAQELVLDGHPNHVRLFYSKDGPAAGRVSARLLLESCLRMRPDRILLAELRAEEAFDYLRNVNSGHPGSITSIHASSARLAFEQLVLLVKQSRAGQELSRADILQLLHALVDVVIQFGVQGGRRYIKEIWYQPGNLREDAGNRG